VGSALVAHEAVRDAVVLVVGTGMQARLHAFVVPETGTAPELVDLRRHCAGFLPPYMNIDALHAIGGFPRTQNGKVDRAALSGLVARGADT
jgi:clorobiocin biosynthesis protein CloN4